MAAMFADNFRADIENSSVGVVLVNLGTPDAPDVPSVRRFLRQFLSDARVVEAPRLLWWLVLNCAILPFRPAKSAAAYREIWSAEGSPLIVNAVRQAQALQQRLAGSCIVCHAMSYGAPSVADALDGLTAQGVRRIVVIPMYPQYSSTTTGSVFDAVGKAMATRRYVPSIRFLNSYATRESYIDSLAESVRAYWREHGRAQRLLMSFHGIPVEYAEKGDPYPTECRATARALAKRLDLADQDWALAFQSRFGPKQWLQPYTEDVLKQSVSDGIARIDAICPGFSADCLETLEEVAMTYREMFIEQGGESLSYIPCLNDSPSHIEMLCELVCETASDWLSQSNSNHRSVADADAAV